jgi:TetR/AcrR family transcriptional regulator, tetracycline repressor protein
LGRPKQALITRDVATRAALAVIDAEGLDGFSLNSVAKAIGVKAPSLYYHFHDKAEILAAVSRLLLSSIDYRNAEGLHWEDMTIRMCLATRRALLQHPNATPLILQFFPRHLLLDAYEAAVAGYPETRGLHMAILEGIEKLTFGSALFAAAAEMRHIAAMPQITPEAYPHLAASIAASAFDDEGNFVEALRMLLAGARLRMAAR